ncbi:TetR/AcrR family transcriptional regulator [Rhodococcus sp. D2-41]|uniref:TetR/AcrR family transcriptional regulator n=1 Tax=Speluncibacter jeojiensis TaxID=2710754 RepID=A0A9X4RE64_9ACTN|nr:TetR/AcrR family transcriptional regulator [Rhodococcus sp. D2-41]MDG3008973.1 TetR/AcrR family transcriptional regulator [Rhodococcus sp. D2-41]MDG3015484.1 TetR/AcrR family transcriptional regulator [Corynebacteriales bacterium D3-21]
MEWSERHTLITEQAAELFATKGIAGTKVRDIADAVGVLSGSLYHYFPSKDAIADVIVSRYLDDLTHEYEAILESTNDPRTRLDELVKASFRVSQSHPHASEIYQNNGTYLRKLPSHRKIRAAAKSTKEAWMTVIEKGIADGAFRSDLPAELLYGLIRDAVWLSLRWFTPTADFGIDQLADSVVSVFLEGVQSRR